jgi:hypothetical protein
MIVAFVLFVVASSVAAAMILDMSIIKHNSAHGVHGLERTEAEVHTIYDQWLARHGRRSYTALGEFECRFRVFWHNLKIVDAHNANAGPHGFRLRMNRFADLTNAEFCAAYLSGAASSHGLHPVGEKYRHDGVEALAESVD